MPRARQDSLPSREWSGLDLDRMSGSHVSRKPGRAPALHWGDVIMEIETQGLPWWILGLALGLGMLFGVPPARAELPPTGAEQAKMAKEIRSNLEADSGLPNSRIDIRVNNDVVTLTGTVDSEAEKLRAARLAEVSGVGVVDDDLKIASGGVRNALTDRGITSSLNTQLLAHASLRHEDISVDTTNGVVTLEGHVSNEDEHGMAVDMARHTAGVARVEDDLTVAPRH
jgi:osmotically-inducible protein OsmY